ncbi:MAG: TonB-dependent receptor [Chitinophagaceae bacterium]|nr:TonB-dependent receptor [Chitinophagaceae bacterium]
MKLIINVFLFSFLYKAGIAQSAVFSERTNSSSANGVLSGKVMDARSKEPLPGATVYVHEAKAGAVADNNGAYRIQNLPAGKLLVEVTYAGYGSYIGTVTMNGDIQMDFLLSPEVVENQGVTVTGVSGATQIKKAPVPVTILKKENLLKDASSNLIDALSKTPGVSQVSTGPAISKPSIRGLGYNRVVVINDGVRQEGQQWGDEHGIEVDEYGVSKAEILKGPASIMYGSDALAGVINFISVVPPPQDMIRGNLFMNYQANNRLRGFHGDVGGNHAGFIWGLNGTYKAAADYKNKYDGYVFNSKFNEKDLSGHIGLNKSWGFTHLLVSSFDQMPGLIEGDRDDATGKFLKRVNNGGVEAEEIATNADFRSTAPFFPRQRIRHFKITTDNSFNIGKSRLTLNIGYQRNRREELGNVLDPEERELYFDLNTVNYNVQYHFAEKNNWKTSVGINGMQQTNKNKGVEQLIPEYSLFDIGGFIYTRKTIDKLTLSGGLRLDNRSVDSKELTDGTGIKFLGFKKDFSNVSASAGVSYEVSGQVVMKLNLARGFRAPSIPELASNGAHEGTNRYEYGEQELRSENSFQVDAGMEWNNEHVSFSASLFYNAVKDFIYYSKLSAAGGGDSVITDGANDFFAFRFRQGNAGLYGAEMNLDIHPHPLHWLHIENTFSYVRGKLSEQQDGSRNLPFIPAARLINELRADLLKKGKAVRNVYAKIELDNTFAQNRPFTGYNTETTSPGYSLLNIGVGGDVMSKGRTVFSLYLAANNVTDVAYQSHLSRLKYTAENLVTGRMGVFNMGRNFSVKLNIPLNFTLRTM